jgi:hypothetical protein
MISCLLCLDFCFWRCFCCGFFRDRSHFEILAATGIDVLSVMLSVLDPRKEFSWWGYAIEYAIVRAKEIEMSSSKCHVHAVVGLRIRMSVGRTKGQRGRCKAEL